MCARRKLARLEASAKTLCYWRVDHLPLFRPGQSLKNSRPDSFLSFGVAAHLIHGDETEFQVGPNCRKPLRLGVEPRAGVPARSEILEQPPQQDAGEPPAAVLRVRSDPVDESRRRVALRAALARGGRYELAVPDYAVNSPYIGCSGQGVADTRLLMISAFLLSITTGTLAVRYLLAIFA